ncbi:MAG: insulinase family protein [Gammaproteobacteria bacterium]|nr:insulinase family protein [Gammaproteobacteria bacterium]
MIQRRLWKPSPHFGFLIAIALTGCATAVTQDTATNKTQKNSIVTETTKGDQGKTDNTSVHEFHLKNGLKVLVKEDHRAPIVVAQIWYKAGSSYEKNGTTGVAHLLEHMMFKGTHKLGPNEFSKIISANGGRENAFTGKDYTAYFQQLEKSRLPISFKLEADRMANLNLSEEEFTKEIQVVMEERRMRTDDKPRSKTYEQFLAAAYVNSPYRHPIIGWMEDLETMVVNDAQQWYQNYYAPNNATLVVVGDVDPQEILVMAKKYYGPLKRQKIPALKPQQEVPQKGERRIVVKEKARLPYLVMGYKVPVLKTAETDWEPYALEMLAYVLDGSDSSRFSKNLVRGQEIATRVGAGYDLYSRMDDLFIFDGTPAQGRNIKELEKAIRQQIEILKTELVDEKELNRIKTQVVANKTYELDSVFYQAMQLGTLETVGLDWRLLDKYVDHFRAVTPEQVRKMAQKFLVDDRLTVAVLEPQPLTEKLLSNKDSGVQHAH